MTQVSCCPVASFHTCVREPACPINTFGHQGNQHLWTSRQSPPLDIKAINTFGHLGNQHPMQAYPNQQLQHQSTCMQQGTQLQHHTQHPMQERSHAQRQLQHQRTAMPSDQHPSRHTYRHCHTCPNNSSSILQITVAPHAGTLTRSSIKAHNTCRHTHAHAQTTAPASTHNDVLGTATAVRLQASPT